jgi:hypothetical protein
MWAAVKRRLMMKDIQLILIAAFLILAVIGAGCITTSTGVVKVGLAPDENGNPVRIRHLNSPITELEVNLEDDPTFKDYQNDIRSIDNIGFHVSGENNMFSSTTFQIFLEPDTAANYLHIDSLLDNFVGLILTGVIFPDRGTVVIDWNASMEYVTGLDEFKEVLKGGVFSLYPTAIPRDNFDINLDSLVVIVTLSGSK